MKIERLIGIITALQQKGKVTSRYLAEKFEVTERTILRDIEDICRAGIPIVTTQGRDGGIMLMEGFSFDTTVFTESELAAILVGLRSLDSISDSARAGQIAEKIGGESVIHLSEGMQIDLSSFYKPILTERIETIREGIREKRCVSFHYYYGKGEADKCIEPYLLLFRWSDWYVFGFCRERQDFRLYKLRRIGKIALTEETFAPREIPPEKLRFGSNITDDYTVEAVYDPALKYRLVEEYGPDSFIELADGTLHTKWGFTTPEAAVGWFLQFGDKVQVLSPPEMVGRIREQAENLCRMYGKMPQT